MIEYKSNFDTHLGFESEYFLVLQRRGNGLLTIITRMLKLGRRRRFGRSPLTSRHKNRQERQSIMSPDGKGEGDSDNLVEFASPAVSLSADLGGSFDSFKTAKSSVSLVDVASLGTPRKLSEEVESDYERERLNEINPIEWLASDAPDDILPRILSFAGPRKLYALSCASKVWRKLTMKDAVWKTMCEDLQKVRISINAVLTRCNFATYIHIFLLTCLYVLNF